MSLTKSAVFKLVCITIILSATVAFAKDYIPTNRDTKLPPEKLLYTIKELNEYEPIYETDNLKYYFKEQRDIIAIVDKRNGYTWTTGIDIPFNKDVDDIVDDAIENNKEIYVQKEDRLNTTYTGIANSLITVEYFDTSNNIKRISSASYEDVTSKFYKISDTHYHLDIKFEKIDLSMIVHVYFDNKGVMYEIKDEDIKGEGSNILAAVLITPFLGSSGGQKLAWDKEKEDFVVQIPNYMKPGYALVPDGCGGLIRFKDNSTSLNTYVGDVYGEDYSQNPYYYEYEKNYIPFKNPSMPVFGIAHGNRQNAFVSYADKGAEYMEIIAMPEENMTYYTWVYPRFVYNNIYHQVYNKKGDGYFTLFEERNHFDIQIRYEFLQGDGSNGEPAADYTGMARAYRNYLLENKELVYKSVNSDDIPIRLDFVMSDAKKSILGFEDVVMTNTNDVYNILLELKNLGINSINSGLYGFQKGGITLGKPWTVSWNRNIGNKKEFISLISQLKDENIDVSFAQNYVNINEEQMSYVNNAAKHINGWHNRLYNESDALPVNDFGYARPIKSIEWLEEQTSKLEKLPTQSMTVDGISNILISDYSRGTFSVTDAIILYQEAFEKLDNQYMINATTPNSYLWKYIDRFLQAPVYTTQFIVETDTVPFLQMVLNGTMEVYAPYSNFSFYTDLDVLRMIDYNVYPSFVLTQKSSHLLSSTNSSNFYSTEYDLYRELIIKIYNQVNDALKFVQDSEWIDRTVIDNGVILNTYDNNTKIVINYTENEIEYEGRKIKPISYEVIR